MNIRKDTSKEIEELAKNIVPRSTKPVGIVPQKITRRPIRIMFGHILM